MKSWLFLLSEQQKFTSIGGSENLYRKELIYEGIFEKDGEFSVGKPDFQRWLSNFREFTNNGNQVFLQLEHDESPEATRGEVINLELAKNESGKDALFGYIKFRDEEAEKMASSAQVSVYVVSDFTDGKGKNYSGGIIRHLALTQSPVIPSLQKFEIAASLVASKKKGKSPMIKMLAKHMGIEGIGDDTPDEIAFSQVLARFSTMQAELAEAKKGKKPDEEDDEEDDDEVVDDDDEEKKKKKKGESPFPMAASIVNRFAKQEKALRTGRIDALLSDGRITKAVADDLKKQYAEEKTLCLSFDQKGDNGFVDGFDTLMSSLAKNDRVLSFHEKTGPQDGSGGESGKVSPVVADAERRAAAYKS